MSISVLVVSTGCRRAERRFDPVEREPAPAATAQPRPPTEPTEPMPREETEFELQDIDADPSPPSELNIEDPVRDAATVLATVNDEQVLLQDVYDEFERLPAQHQQQYVNRQNLLLEELIQLRVLLQRAAEMGVKDTPAYARMAEEFKSHPAAGELSEETIERSALIEALLHLEVAEKVEIPEQEIRTVFEQYQGMTSESLDFEEVKPHIAQLLLRPHLEEYMEGLKADARVEVVDEEWVEEQKSEVQHMPPEMQPDTQSPPDGR